MGFAVEKCGVSNTEIEIATRSNTLRTFTCYFNNEAGAVAGQMLGVVKDGLNGQVLFTDWNVPVEVPVATSTISIPATDFVRGVNVALSANGYGTDTLMNAPPYGPADNSAEWDITVPVAGRYELFATYASSENRPLTISFNGVVAFTNALATNTGGFFPANRVTLSQGIVQLTVGANVMKVAETGINVFPHIKGFTLVPVSLINDSFQVNANAPLGTDFTVPSGTTSCTFNSTGKWRLAPFLPEVDANGSGPSAPGLYMDPGVAAALIALRVGSNPGYVHIGVSKTLSVTTGDSLNLKINDYPNSHVDDSGVLTVSWQCQ